MKYIWILMSASVFTLLRYVILVERSEENPDPLKGSQGYLGLSSPHFENQYYHAKVRTIFL